MIYLGNKKIDELYMGGSKISEAYLGSELVYSAKPKNGFTITVNETDSYTLQINGNNKNIYLEADTPTFIEVPELQSMYCLLLYAGYHVTYVDVSTLDSSNVTNMSYAFSGLVSITSLDLSKLDTSKVTNMSNMFADSTSLEFLDLSNFDASKVTSYSNMFYKCISSLKRIRCRQAFKDWLYSVAGNTSGYFEFELDKITWEIVG